MMKNFFIVVWMVLLGPGVYAQLFRKVFSENNFTGRVYQNYTDSKGFTWISTDQGIYRWDSKNLEKFTINDGLPHNEVFKVYEDSKDRIWMTFYSGEICYFLHGKIFNKFSDDRLTKIPRVNTIDIIEHKGVLYFNGVNPEQTCDDFKVSEIQFDADLKINVLERKFISRIHVINDQILVTEKGSLYNFNEKQKSLLFNESSLSYSAERVNHLHYVYVQDEHVVHFFNDRHCFDSARIIPNSQCLGRYQDDYLFLNRNIIYSSRNQQIDTIAKFNTNYFLRSDQNIQLLLTEQNRRNLFISSLDKIQQIQTLVESDRINKIIWFQNQLWLLNNDYTLVNNNTKEQIVLDKGKEFDNYNLYNLISADNKLTITTGLGIYTIDAINKRPQKVGVKTESKAYSLWNNFKHSQYYRGHLYANTGQGLFDYFSNDAGILYSGRISSFYIDSRHLLWISTPDGIFRTNNFNPFVSDLKKMITTKINIQANDFAEDSSGNLLIASNNGIYMFSTYDSLKAITMDNGLTSDNCRKIELDKDGSLWVSTDKGLNHLQYYDRGKFNIKTINFFLKEDGILSDNIKDFLLKGDSIFISTDKGINLIRNKNWMPERDSIRIHLNNLWVNGEKIHQFQFPELKTNENTLQIDLSAIYYARPDRMKLVYDLIDGDHLTRQVIQDRSILLQSLKPGNYKLLISAFDQDYPLIRSQTKELKFTIKPPFYKTYWFLILTVLMMTGISGSILFLYFKRKNELLAFSYNKLESDKKLSRFKLEALKAEMNPHFIFNCLNSIKDFMLKNDQENSQYYLSQLSKLIRIALYNTKHEFMILQNELEFIDLYVELEQLRHTNKFTYTKLISNPELLNAEIPTMILQPFFENSIRHGKIGQLNKQGKLILEIFEENKYIVFKIKDNGMGIQYSQRLKENQRQEHQSMAMNLIRERIEIYNRSYGLDIQLDLYEINDGEFSTEVVMKYLLD